jgi:hypothetical protein
MARKQKIDPVLTMIQDKLDAIHKDVKEVREKDIPNLKVEVAVMKEKTSTHAKIVSAIGGLIAIATSAAIAYMR